MSAMSKTIPITRRQRGVGDVTDGGLSDTSNVFPAVPVPRTACSQRRGITAAKFKALSRRPMCELADYCVHCPAVKMYHALSTDLLPTRRRLDLSLVLSSLVSILYIVSTHKKKLASTMQYCYVKLLPMCIMNRKKLTQNILTHYWALKPFLKKPQCALCNILF